MPGVRVHNVPAEWLEDLAEHYESLGKIGRAYEKHFGYLMPRTIEYERKAQEVRDYIAAQGEHNA